MIASLNNIKESKKYSDLDLVEGRIVIMKVHTLYMAQINIYRNLKQLHQLKITGVLNKKKQIQVQVFQIDMFVVLN